jgi:hypothetical protein
MRGCPFFVTVKIVRGLHFVNRQHHDWIAVLAKYGSGVVDVAGRCAGGEWLGVGGNGDVSYCAGDFV